MSGDTWRPPPSNSRQEYAANSYFSAVAFHLLILVSEFVIGIFFWACDAVSTPEDKSKQQEFLFYKVCVCVYRELLCVGAHATPVVIKSLYLRPCLTFIFSSSYRISVYAHTLGDTGRLGEPRSIVLLA